MKLPKRMRGQVGAHSHQRAPRQEKELANRLKGNTVRGSGSGNEKGDVRIKGLLRLEAKTTKNKSFSVTREMIQKIEQAAMTHDELPVLVVEFNDEGRKAGELAVMPVWALEQLIAKANDN